MSDIQVQWALESTAAGTVNIARGVLKAATSDDVQPLAIVVCERFGTTLAMSPTTCEQIRELVVPAGEFTLVKFLKSAVGWSKNDSVSQLGNSQSGLKFLGLAAALNSTDAYRGAKALHSMITSNASQEDKALIPTVTQVQDLLEALSPRCQLSRFSEIVLNWQLVLAQYDSHLGPRNGDYTVWCLPEDGVKRLVDAFREISRLGDASVTGVTIKTTSWMAWIVAFTEWCLGSPPHIYYDDGRDISLVHKSDSPVFLHISSKGAADQPVCEISMRYDSGIEEPRQLVDVGDGNAKLTGMPRIEEYGRWLQQSRGFGASQASLTGDEGVIPQAPQREASGKATPEQRARLAQLAFEEIMPYALHQVLSCLNFSSVPAPQLRPHPIPGRQWQSVCNVMRLLFKYELSELISHDGGIIGEYPTTKQFLQSKRQACACFKCRADTPNRGAPAGDAFGMCEVDLVYLNLSVITADVLALSLFNYPDRLHIQPTIPQHSRARSSQSFIGVVMDILQAGKTRQCDVLTLVDHALALVGHDVTRQLRENVWVMSCYRGLAVWPAIFDTKVIEKHGFWALNCARGNLTYKGACYSLVKGWGNYHGHWAVAREPDPQPVIRPLALFPHLEMSFKIQIEDKELKVGLGLDNEGLFASYRISPVRSLLNLTNAIILEACQHDADAELPEPDKFCEYLRYPIFDIAEEELNRVHGIHTIRVIGVDKNDSLRLFSCGMMTVRLVIRKEACLSCCLRVCRENGYRVLVL